MDRRQIFATYTTEKSCTVKICPQNSLLHKSSNTAGIWPIWGGCMAELKQWVSDLAEKPNVVQKTANIGNIWAKHNPGCELVGTGKKNTGY